MQKIDLGQTISILANVGVIAGIIFLAYEIRQSTVAANVSAADYYIASINEVSNLIVENDELVPLILRSRGNEALSAEENLRLTLVWGNALRNWQRAYYLHKEGVLDEIFWRTQLGDMSSTLATNRHLYEFWDERRDRYDPAFNEILEGFGIGFDAL